MTASDMRLGVAQPRSHKHEEHRNVDVALETMEEASEEGVEFLCFPEGYPGPYFTEPGGYDPDERIRAKADELGLHVAYGRLEDSDEGYYVTQFVIGPDGEELGKSRRRMPMGPPLYQAGEVFPSGCDFDEIAFGDEIPVIETELGWNVGIIICSEMFCPELTRVAVLKGADVVLFPSGWPVGGLRRPWQEVTKSRAIENLVYTAVNQHRYAERPGIEPLIGMIASPEEVLAQSDRDTIVTADLNMDRLEWLRDRPEGISVFEYKAVPGLSNGLRFYTYDGEDISRRIDLYEPLTMTPEELQEVSVRPEIYEDIPDHLDQERTADADGPSSVEAEDD
jgi:predicted amidohydrolase